MRFILPLLSHVQPPQTRRPDTSKPHILTYTRHPINALTNPHTVGARRRDRRAARQRDAGRGGAQGGGRQGRQDQGETTVCVCLLFVVFLCWGGWSTAQLPHLPPALTLTPPPSLHKHITTYNNANKIHQQHTNKTEQGRAAPHAHVHPVHAAAVRRRH